MTDPIFALLETMSPQQANTAMVALLRQLDGVGEIDKETGQVHVSDDELLAAVSQVELPLPVASLLLRRLREIAANGWAVADGKPLFPWATLTDPRRANLLGQRELNKAGVAPDTPPDQLPLALASRFDNAPELPRSASGGGRPTTDHAPEWRGRGQRAGAWHPRLGQGRSRLLRQGVAREEWWKLCWGIDKDCCDRIRAMVDDGRTWTFIAGSSSWMAKLPRWVLALIAGYFVYLISAIELNRTRNGVWLCCLCIDPTIVWAEGR